MGGAGQPVAAGHGLVLHEGDDGDLQSPGLLLDTRQLNSHLSLVGDHRAFALIGCVHDVAKARCLSLLCLKVKAYLGAFRFVFMA